jgi:hypothetical protein
VGVIQSHVFKLYPNVILESVIMRSLEHHGMDWRFYFLNYNSPFHALDHSDRLCHPYPQNDTCFLQTRPHPPSAPCHHGLTTSRWHYQPPPGGVPPQRLLRNTLFAKRHQNTSNHRLALSSHCILSSVSLPCAISLASRTSISLPSTDSSCNYPCSSALSPEECRGFPI